MHKGTFGNIQQNYIFSHLLSHNIETTFILKLSAINKERENTKERQNTILKRWYVQHLATHLKLVFAAFLQKH